MNDLVVQVEGVSVDLGGVEVLSEVDLRVARGDFLAVVGPNGGGKTTLLRLILGLLRPRSGEVRVFGHAPGAEPGRIGYVPQHGNPAPSFPACAEEVVLMGLAHGWRHGPYFRRDERERARHALERAGVGALASRRMDELSGGQRQRVLVARALITEPELLLLDEPLSNIDPYGRQCVLEALTGLRSDITIVMVSHDLGITANAVTGIAVVNHYLLQVEGRALTPEMLALMYGVHEPGCPANAAIRELATSLLNQGGHDESH